MGLRHTLEQVLEWLRAGYPAGVPQEDYVALLGILHRRLDDAEVAEIARQYAATANGPKISDSEIEQLLEAATHQQATPEDVRRVSATLAAGGWPLAAVVAADAPPAHDSSHGSD